MADAVGNKDAKNYFLTDRYRIQAFLPKDWETPTGE